MPDNERELFDILRSIIHDTLPHCVERLSYNAPYYYRFSRICFVWPASVPWGNVKGDGVLLGFCKGYLLGDEISYLDKGNRKEVYTKRFLIKKDIDFDLIRSYLLDAYILDEEIGKTKA